MTYYLVIQRIHGSRLNQTQAPHLLNDQAGEFAKWHAPVDGLADAGIVVKPTSVQWLAFEDDTDPAGKSGETKASEWLGGAGVQALLAGSFVSGYKNDFDPAHANDKVVLLLSRWTAASDDVTPSSGRCTKCPPVGTTSIWIGYENPAYASPVQTLVYSFESLIACGIWLNAAANQGVLNGALMALRVQPS